MDTSICGIPVENTLSLEKSKIFLFLFFCQGGQKYSAVFLNPWVANQKWVVRIFERIVNNHRKIQESMGFSLQVERVPAGKGLLGVGPRAAMCMCTGTHAHGSQAGWREDPTALCR